MNLSTTLLLAAALFSCVFVMLKIERNRWFMGAFFYVAPVLLLMGLWASLTDSWSELLIAVLVALGITGAWWAVWGRKLKRAESTIKVWGQDAAPKPKAALQAEIDQLKEEKAQLEEELKKIKTERN
jgi:hypothetical protein